MRLVTYTVGPAEGARAGVRVGHRVLDIEAASRVNGEPLPASLKALLAAGRGALARVQALAKAAATEARSFSHAMHEERAVRLLPPVPDADHVLCADAAFGGAGLVGHEARVALPKGGSRLECGPALVFVIGRRAQGVKEADAMDHAFGVTVLNDLAWRSARDGRHPPAPVARPLGPEIVTLDELPDPHELWFACRVNGEERLRVNAAGPFQRFPAILEQVARGDALEPGDLLCPGEPCGGESGGLVLEAGDVVECGIEGITMLRTMVVAAGDA